jgi:hypothetical protein
MGTAALLMSVDDLCEIETSIYLGLQMRQDPERV